MNRPLILVTNDDGITAPGIKALVAVAREIGEVVVVAPDSPQSGKGHAVTLTDPLRLKKRKVFDGIEAYECTGTPVDCVKLAVNVILKDRKVDLCVSGVNHGANDSINILYSGTMSAAMEASLEGIDSIGFSYLDHSYNADFSVAQEVAKKCIHFVLENGIQNAKLINVNIPMLPLEELKGIKICRQAEGRWKEEFVKGEDPRGGTYYWLTGKFIVQEEMDDTDVWALQNGFASVVPSWHDLTKYDAIDHLKGLES